LAQAPTPGPLIRLYPVAVDAAGQPVTDLTADDFKVTDQSKPETIFAFRQPNTAAAPKLDVLEFSNRASKTPHTTVILFDMINLLDADRLENWKTLDKAIPQLDSGEHVFFYVLNLEGTLIPIHQMGVPSPDDKTWHQNVATAFDKVMKASSHARPVQVGAEEQQKKTFKAFEDLANTLSVFPGRRDILWLANGLTTVDDPKLESSNGDWVERALYVPHLAVTLANDGVAVDPYVLSGNLNADVNYNMDQMALLTGGHYYSRQDVKTVVNQVAQDAISSYTLLYDPGSDNWNSKWHRLHVTCERKGVKVQLRERYYAVADARSAVDRNRAALMAGFQSPGDFAGIGLRVKFAPLDGKAGIHIEIRIDPADLQLHEQGGKYSGALYCLISDHNGPAALGEPSVMDIKPELTAEQYKNALKDGLPINQDHPVSDAVKQVRVIVLDQTTNEVGSITFPVK
jgi:VWFA-related protein